MIFGCKRVNCDEMDGKRPRLPAHRNCYRLSCISWALAQISCLIWHSLTKGTDEKTENNGRNHEAPVPNVIITYKCNAKEHKDDAVTCRTTYNTAMTTIHRLRQNSVYPFIRDQFMKSHKNFHTFFLKKHLKIFPSSSYVSNLVMRRLFIAFS